MGLVIGGRATSERAGGAMTVGGRISTGRTILLAATMIPGGCRRRQKDVIVVLVGRGAELLLLLEMVMSHGDDQGLIEAVAKWQQQPVVTLCILLNCCFYASPAPKAD